jgi:hypothetical protein
MQQGQTSILPPNLLEALNGLVDRLNESTPSVRVLLIGTNEGVCLSRCYGSVTSRDPTEASPAAVAPIREDILTSIETAWATLPSGCPPQVLASHVISDTFQQPAHPLLKPIGLGDTVKTVTAFYDHATLIHFHLSPLVITILATPHVNINIIQSVALPIVKFLLEPVAQAIVASRKENASYSNVQQQQKTVQSIVNR